MKPQAGTSAAGLSIRNHKLYVAGGETGRGYVYNTKTGRRLATFQLTDGPTFINDVVATRRGAWFTDSVNPVLYRVPVRRNGAPGHHVTTIPLKGITYTTGFNLNGIDGTRARGDS